MFYKLLKSAHSKKSVYLAPETIQHNNLTEVDSLRIKAGFNECSVRLAADPALPPGVLKVSSDVLETLSLPSSLSYQLKITTRRIELGPVIGLLIARSDLSLTQSLQECSKYTLLYPEHEGLLYVCSEEGINFSQQYIDGYYYNPISEKPETPWQKSRLPFPSALYRRTYTARDTVQKLKIITNNRLFNSHFFDKWEFWQLCSQNKAIRSHLPETALLTPSLAELGSFLDRYESVFFKPAFGTLGRGILKLSSKGGTYHFQRKLDDAETKIAHKEEAFAFLKGFTKNSRYLIQQYIPALKFEDRCSDFRVIMQKDQTKTWQCTAIIARVGRRGGISANFQARGFVLSFEDFFRKACSLKEKKLFGLKQDLLEVCRQVCLGLDETGECYGDLGIDVIVDDSLNIWVIEVNKRHNHGIVMSLGSEQTYYAVKTTPIKYAVALSGFKI